MTDDQARRIDAAVKLVDTTTEIARRATLDQVRDLLMERIVPGARIPTAPNGVLRAHNLREWLIEMIEELR